MQAAANAGGGRHEETGARELPGSEDREGAPGAGLDALTTSRHAAAVTLALGEAPGGDGRFRESDFYISPVRQAPTPRCAARRYQLGGHAAQHNMTATGG